MQCDSIPINEPNNLCDRQLSLAPITLDLTGLEVLQKLNSIQDNPSPTSSHIDDIIDKVSKGDFSPNIILKQNEESMIVESTNNVVVEEDV